MDPERAEYLATIERRFVALRGKGFMLSPRDVMLVESWRTRGIPARVVLGALEEGALRYAETHPAGAPLPGSLAYFAGHVDDAWAARRELLLEEGGPASPAPPAPPSAAAPLEGVLDAVVQAGRAQTDEAATEVLRGVWRQLRGAAVEADPWALTARVDAEMVDGLAATLPAGALAEVTERADVAVAQAGGETLSARARADLERAEFERAVRTRFGVPDLVEVLLEQSM